MRDVTGRSRVNMFEKITSPSGKVFKPTLQIGNEVTYEVSDGTTLTTSNLRLNGAELEQMQDIQAMYPR